LSAPGAATNRLDRAYKRAGSLGKHDAVCGFIAIFVPPQAQWGPSIVVIAVTAELKIGERFVGTLPRGEIRTISQINRPKSWPTFGRRQLGRKTKCCKATSYRPSVPLASNDQL
jgi:hypothetical protein